MTGDHGSWVLHHVPSGIGPDETFPLLFKVLGDRVRFQQADSPAFFDIRWRLEGDTLNLEVVGSDWNTAQAQITLNGFFGGGWSKVE